MSVEGVTGAHGLTSYEVAIGVLALLRLGGVGVGTNVRTASGTVEHDAHRPQIPSKATSSRGDEGGARGGEPHGRGLGPGRKH